MELLSSLEATISVVWPLQVLKGMETNEIINTDLIVCHNIIKHLDKDTNIKLMKFLAKCNFNNILFEHDPECLNYSKTNLLQFPFNFYQFTRYGTVVLMTKEQFLNNLVNLNKLIIKCYNGVSMREYIMYQFHE